MFNNIVFGFCLWDILAGGALLAVIVGFIAQQRNHKKKMQHFKEV